MVVIAITFWLTNPQAAGEPRYFIAGSTASKPLSQVINIQTVTLENAVLRLSADTNSPYCEGGIGSFIEFNGVITQQATMVMAGLLSQAIPCVAADDPEYNYPVNVYLNSTGAMVSQGFLMAKLMMLHGVLTIVTDGQECISMCTIVFLAAPQRTIEHSGALGFHSPYQPAHVKDGTLIPVNCDVEATKEVFKTFYIEVLGEGIGKIMYSKTMAICDPDDSWTVDRETALEYNLLTE